MKAPIAIIYDFDGTLAKGNIQETSFIPKLGITKEKFWQEVREVAREKSADQILAYMYLLVEKARDTGTVRFTREALIEHGAKVQCFAGVEDWFERINRYAVAQETTVEHYLISSATKEMIEGTPIYRHFKHVYASSFMYDQNSVAVWPAVAINYTNKTQYLFRINKNILNSWDDSKINEYTPQEKRRIPFDNMIYIGDGMTDVPAMKMVNYQGGWTIGVFDPGNQEGEEQVQELMEHGRVRYSALADYRLDSKLDKIIKNIINLLASRTNAPGHSRSNLRRRQK